MFKIQEEEITKENKQKYEKLLLKELKISGDIEKEWEKLQ